MKVCILGTGLTTLTLAKCLINLGISVDIISNNEKKKNRTRTIGISNENIKFINREIENIEKYLWNINKIEIFSQNLNNKKILEFQDHNCLFALFKNDKLYDYFYSKLKKEKLFKLRKKFNIEDYKLVINCEKNNLFSKKYFYRNIKKDYDSFAYTTIFRHKKLPKNNIAQQIFTNKGPLAFLPVSHNETSIVFSVKGKESIDLKQYVKRYGIKYSNIEIKKIEKFKISSTNLRNYYHKNILAFGDLLHKLHPLAGQGFNMTIRDIKILIKLIKLKVENGLDLDSSICFDFEKQTKHKNYLFASGIDFIYELFNFENKLGNKLISNSIKFIGKKEYVNKTLKQYADNGIMI